MNPTKSISDNHSHSSKINHTETARYNMMPEQIEQLTKQYNIFSNNGSYSSTEKTEQLEKMLKHAIELLQKNGDTTNRFENLYKLSQAVQKPANKLLTFKEENETTKKELSKVLSPFNHFLNEIQSEMKTQEEIDIENTLSSISRFQTKLASCQKKEELILKKINEVIEKTKEPKNAQEAISSHTTLCKEESKFIEEFGLLIQKTEEQLKKIQEFILNFENKEIPKEGKHIEYIATYTDGITSEVVLDKISLKKETYENIKIKHDELAKALVETLKLKDLIRWHLIKLKTSCGTHGELVTLNDNISILSSAIETRKKEISEAGLKTQNKEEQLNLAKQRLLENYKTYLSQKEKGEKIFKLVEESINDLEKMIENPFDNEIKMIKFYDKNVKNSIDSVVSNHLKDISIEKNDVGDRLAIGLKNAKFKLGKNGNKTELVYEINRTAHAIKNGGVFNVDMLFGQSWVSSYNWLDLDKFFEIG